MYSYGSPHTAAQKQDDQHERTFSSYVRIQVVVLKTYLGRWTIGRSGERGSGISVLPAWYDYDDDDDIYIYIQDRIELTELSNSQFLAYVIVGRNLDHSVRKSHRRKNDSYQGLSTLSLETYDLFMIQSIFF